MMANEKVQFIYFCVIIAFFSSFLPIRVLGSEFSYKNNSEVGPLNWLHHFPECGGQRQSPIALSVLSCEHYVKVNPPIVVQSLYQEPKTVTILNNGHSVQYSFTWPNNEPPFIIGGNLGSRYIFSTFHFHFGKDNSEGSEHTIDSERFPLEIHLIFYNENYQDLSSAMPSPNGLVVIGLMFASSNSAPNYDILNQLLLVRRPETERTFSYRGLQKLVDFSELLKSDYVTYQGSLTTPPCHETVTWFIDTKVRKISKLQLALFRWLNGNDGLMVSNFRPLQSNNNRSCTYYH